MVLFIGISICVIVLAVMLAWRQAGYNEPF
jgi:hypothetical protein